MKKLSKTLYGEFADKKTPHGDKVIWISWGDCMQWDLQSVRMGMIALYGKDAVSSIRKGRKGVYSFRYDSKVDFKKLGKHLGVQYSGPSVSSSSSAPCNNDSRKCVLKRDAILGGHRCKNCGRHFPYGCMWDEN